MKVFQLVLFITFWLSEGWVVSVGTVVNPNVRTPFPCWLGLVGFLLMLKGVCFKDFKRRKHRKKDDTNNSGDGNVEQLSIEINHHKPDSSVSEAEISGSMLRLCGQSQETTAKAASIHWEDETTIDSRISEARKLRYSGSLNRVGSQNQSHPSLAVSSCQTVCQNSELCKDVIGDRSLNFICMKALHQARIEGGNSTHNGQMINTPSFNASSRDYYKKKDIQRSVINIKLNGSPVTEHVDRRLFTTAISIPPKPVSKQKVNNDEYEPTEFESSEGRKSEVKVTRVSSAEVKRSGTDKVSLDQQDPQKLEQLYDDMQQRKLRNIQQDFKQSLSSSGASKSKLPEHQSSKITQADSNRSTYCNNRASAMTATEFESISYPQQVLLQQESMCWGDLTFMGSTLDKVNDIPSSSYSPLTRSSASAMTATEFESSEGRKSEVKVTRVSSAEVKRSGTDKVSLDQQDPQKLEQLYDDMQQRKLRNIQQDFKQSLSSSGASYRYHRWVTATEFEGSKGRKSEVKVARVSSAEVKRPGTDKVASKNSSKVSS